MKDIPVRVAIVGAAKRSNYFYGLLLKPCSGSR